MVLRKYVTGRRRLGWDAPLEKLRMAKKDTPDLVRLEWLVESRSTNQRLSLDLYKLLRNHGKSIRDDNDFINTAQGLVAVVFSLWRAVFLSEVTTEDRSGMIDHAEVFLAT